MKIFSTLKKQATSFLEQYKQQSPATYAAAEQAIGAILILDGLVGIDNPLGSNKRPGIFGTLLGLVIGIVFLFVPTVFGNLSGTDKMTATTSATVVAVGMNTGSSDSNNSGTCPLTARYTVNGKEYTKQSSMSSSSNCSLSEGQTITINYNPDFPSSWANDVKSFGFFLQIFFWAGMFVIISSIVTFIIRLLSIIFGWKLLKDGRKLAATLPKDTNFQTLINEIKQNFVGTVFSFGGSGVKSTFVPTQTTAQSSVQNNPPTPPVTQAKPMATNAVSTPDPNNTPDPEIDSEIK
ncbi:MAG: DUF3592 domain-containing protein [bacterium]